MFTSPAAIETAPSIDPAAVHARRQVARSPDDHAVVGTTLRIVGEEPCAADAMSRVGHDMRMSPRAGTGRVAWHAAFALLIAGACAPQAAQSDAQPAATPARPHVVAVFDAFFACREAKVA